MHPNALSDFSVLPRPEVLCTPKAQQLKILIIDQDDATSGILSRQLQQQGYTTSMARSGATGLQKAQIERPNLVLLDTRLPDLDGYCVCERLADASGTCTIPVIMLSRAAGRDTVRRSRAAGCHYFLRKPYDPNVLLTLIHQAIHEAQNPPIDL